ncbi:MAG: nucleotide exchange factor GrpE [Pseudonocardiales bacterium]|nr:nucleotide exchange factor GrpE [Pseudonocardiales bacterium]MBV9030681.1 nucleotide exchange factor GrpE [Pseudonocardiales bacterium]MBW0011404.1 nucleotide exchange factor GrpE [Pseudonocardiales bacterium]
MQSEPTGVHQDPEQAGPDRSPEDRVEVALPDRDAVATLEDRLRRALDNLRKRYARELERQRAAEANRVAAAWLLVLDNLDLALDHADADPSTIIEGVRTVRDQALAVLASLGFSRHDEVGVPFDPTRHEVVTVVDDSEAEPGTVVRVLRPGYGTAERQLRPGAVTVAGRRG